MWADLSSRAMKREQPIEHISDTAYWIAAYRARESRRPRAVFHDPLAERLADGRGEAVARYLGHSTMLDWSVTVRTAIIDDFMAEALRAGVDTVLNLGAGFDTRPYRLALPADLRWIEVDFAPVMDFKARRLVGETPRCQLERVGLDLLDKPARAAFFARVNAGARSVFVLSEGLVSYLDLAQAGSLAEELAHQSQFQYWVTDYFASAFKKFFQAGRFGRRMQAHAPVLFYPENWHAFFADHGWAVAQMRYLAEEGRRLNRPPPHSWIVRSVLRFLPAEKHAALDRMAGYALLKPAKSI